jgi:hypothetical protein
MGNTKHQDRWRDTRYPVNIRIELELKDGTRLLVSTTNFSATGLQFICDGWVARKIEPKGIHLHSPNHIDLKIRSEEHKLLINAQIVYARRLSENEFIIGVYFTDPVENSKNILGKIIG